MTASAYLPDTGDLVWKDFGPSKGREQAGRRPALVVSPASFTENTGLAVLCPITSRVRPLPTSVVLAASSPIAGEILISHIRSIDAQSAMRVPLCRTRSVSWFGRSSTPSSRFESVCERSKPNVPGRKNPALWLSLRTGRRLPWL